MTDTWLTAAGIGSGTGTLAQDTGQVNHFPSLSLDVSFHA
jgi:hypothetical protein